jgi:tetratricopeptide (TPR) repeat protein
MGAGLHISSRTRTGFTPFNLLHPWLLLGVLVCYAAGISAAPDPAPQEAPAIHAQDTPGEQPAADEAESNDSDFAPEYGNFSEDILTRAILAELAGQRGYNQQALDEYLVLARETGDLNIIQRTMRIASFLRNVPAALEMGNLWLAREPDSAEARQTIALQMVAMGRYRDALEQLVALLDLGHPVDFRLISARTATDQNAALVLAALIGDFEALLPRHPEHETLRLGLAHLYQQNQQIRQAYNLVQELAKDMDDSPEVVMLEVQLLELLGESSRAQRRLAQSLRNNPDHKQLRFMYGRKLIELERFQDAREQFTLLVEQDPNDFDMVYSLALLSMEVNMFAEARSYLQRLVVNGRRLDDAHYYLGFINGQENDPATAIQHYLLVKGGNNFLQAQRNLTELMIRDGRYEEVKAHLQNIRFRNADFNIPLLSMEANVLMDEGLHDEAALVLNNSIGAFPNNIQLLFLRSVLSQEQNDLVLMEQDLRKIIQLNPTSPVAYNSLGYTLADRTDRFQEAYDLIKRAAELAPNDPAIIDSLGWVQYRLGQYDEARQNLDRAYELYPDHEVAAHLGEVLWVMGERTAATRIWRDALEMQPDSEFILEAMERLDAGASI